MFQNRCLLTFVRFNSMLNLIYSSLFAGCFSGNGPGWHICIFVQHHGHQLFGHRTTTAIRICLQEGEEHRSWWALTVVRTFTRDRLRMNKIDKNRHLVDSD